MNEITIIGGGLAGCEAAWQAAKRGCAVSLYDMKPLHYSPAHSSPLLAELVCSNSFRSDDLYLAVGLLKEEMRRCGSLIMQTANETRVAAGKALAVDRQEFAEKITKAMENHPLIRLIHEEVTELPISTSAPCILATGPLTSEPLAQALAELTGSNRLFFYDAIAPIVLADSLNMDIIYQKSRYDDGPGDYLNCPMDKETYQHFVQQLNSASYVPLKAFEEPKYFEGCLPVEVLAGRGKDTLRFGPMKPVGLADPRTGREPYAAVQLRRENQVGSAYNLVGFQTKLTYSEQNRIFRMIPGLEQAEFARLGSIHRNTFICAPLILKPTLECAERANLFIAGQLSGVEGYVESAAMGLLAGINAARRAADLTPLNPPQETALGSLITHLTQTDAKIFQPSNINFGLFPAWEKKMPKRLRGQIRAERALLALAAWQQENQLT